MSTTQARNKERIREYLDALNDHDFEAALEIYASDYTTTITHPTGEEEALDVEELAERWTEYVDAFPDLNAEVHEMAADGEWVMARVELSGTHRGEFWGIEPRPDDHSRFPTVSPARTGSVRRTTTEGDRTVVA